jgi:hypothetical protein
MSSDAAKQQPQERLAEVVPLRPRRPERRGGPPPPHLRAELDRLKATWREQRIAEARLVWEHVSEEADRVRQRALERKRLEQADKEGAQR